MTEAKASENVIKVAQALGFLLSLDENHKMNRVKLIKLLWAADRLHMRKFGRTVSDSEYYAMAHGPVCSLALDIAQLNKDGIALSESDLRYLEEYFTADDRDTSMQKEIGQDHLSETDQEMLRAAWEKFKDVDTFELADSISHDYPEWQKFQGYFATSGGRKSIDVRDFFKNPEGSDQYFAEDSGQLAAAQEYYEDFLQAEQELRAALGAE